MDIIDSKYLDWLEEASIHLTMHVQRAYERLSLERYKQEPGYVAALLARLDGVVYDGPKGYLEILSTIVNDRGANSAESKWGADFAITAKISHCLYMKPKVKAVLGQAKRGFVFDLDNKEQARLTQQCSKMKATTNSYIVLEIPLSSLSSEPTVLWSGQHGDINLEEKLDVWPFSRQTLSSYLIDMLLACYHGDIRQEFINAVSCSTLNKLHIDAKGYL